MAPILVTLASNATVPADYTYSYDHTPQPPPPNRPPPPPPHPPPPPTSIELCSNSCLQAPKFASDGFCDDGGADAVFSNCDLGTDCDDCGLRVRLAHVPATPMPPPALAPAAAAVATLPAQQLPVPTTKPRQNPFSQQGQERAYIDPSHRVALARAMHGMSGTTLVNLLYAWKAPVAFWIRSKRAIRGEAMQDLRVPITAEGILNDASSQGASPVVLVLALLPDRSCLKPSAGSEICCTYRPAFVGSRFGSDCSRHPSDPPRCDEGIAEYKHDVVDRLASVLADWHLKVRTVLVLEPDTLAHMASSGGRHPGCSREATRAAYLEGIEYAIHTIRNSAPSVAMYLAAGNGELLGWGERVNAFATSVAKLGAVGQLHGFATNIGGYAPLGRACPQITDARTRLPLSLPTFCRSRRHDPCCNDPCGLIETFNSGVGELNFVQMLSKHLKMAMPNMGEPHFIIDTARNGYAQARDDCAAACNLRTAKFGLLPTAVTGVDVVDAFWWLTPPGASDGCASWQAQPQDDCPRPDASCSLDDSLGTRAGEAFAPPAGATFTSHLQQLAQGEAELCRSASPNSDTCQVNFEVVDKFAQEVGIPSPVFGSSSSPSLGAANVVLLSWGTLLVVLLCTLYGRLRSHSAPRQYQGDCVDDEVYQ